MKTVSREGADSVVRDTSRTASSVIAAPQDSLPWSVDGCVIYTAAGDVVVEDTEDGDVEDWLRKQFIVRAVNSHAELLAACKDALDMLNNMLGDCDADCTCVQHPLRAAIERAEGPQ